MASAARLEDSEIQNHVDNEALMNCIQNYPIIYDKRSHDYKILLWKKNAWKAVATELGISEKRKLDITAPQPARDEPHTFQSRVALPPIWHSVAPSKR